MRLVLRNYLSSLKEDGELDKICVEMLEDLGLTVHASAQKGTRQYGVDVLAHGRLPGCDEDKVYALIIKCENIDRGEFDKEKTGVAASIKECLNVYAQNLLPFECQTLPLVVCIVCGGEIKFDVRADLSALTTREFSWYRNRHGYKLECEEWTGDKLASMLVNSLQNSNLLVNGDKRLLFRALALADASQESFRAFREFVDRILDFSRVSRKALRLKALREVNLALAMLIHECEHQDVRNLDAAWMSSEYVYLREWEYVQRCNCEKCFDKKFDSSIEDAARMYCKVGEAYIDRVSIFARERYGFTLAVDGNDELDVILRFYDVLGRVASFGMYVLESDGRFCSRDGKPVDEARFSEMRSKVLDLLTNLLTGNSVAATPILDSHSFAITLCLKFLCLNGAKKFAGDWMEILVAGIGVLFGQGYGYPVTGLGYKDLLEHLHGSIDGRGVEELVKASELIPALALAAIKMNRDDIYDNVCKLAMSLSHKINYQAWFFDEDGEKSFYCGHNLRGSQLCSLSIENKEDLVGIIKAEAQASPVRLSCIGTLHSGLLYIGCRHHGFPLPGNLLV